MPGPHTTAHNRGIAFGAAILTLFGLFWAVAALLNWPAHPRWTIVLASLIATSLIAASAFQICFPGGIPAPDPSKAAAEGRRSGTLFGIIFTLEGVFIALAAAFLSRHHLDSWIPAAAAFIVGIHFLPLARVFRVPLYYFTGILAAAAALGSAAISNTSARSVFVGLAMTAILWLSAIAALLQSRRHA